MWDGNSTAIATAATATATVFTVWSLTKLLSSSSSSNDKCGIPRAVLWFVPGWVELLRLVASGSLLKYIQAKSKAVGGSKLFFVRTAIVFPANPPSLIVIDPDDQVAIMRQEGKLGLTVYTGPSIPLLLGPGNMQFLAGDNHKKMRKVFSSLLAPRAMESFVPSIVAAFTKMWDDLETKCRESPTEKFIIQDIIRDAQFRLMADVLFGMKSSEGVETEQILRQLHEDSEKLSEGITSFSKSSSTVRTAMEASERIKTLLYARLQTIMDARRRGGQPNEMPVTNALDVIADYLLKQEEEEENRSTKDEMKGMIRENVALLLDASHATTMAMTTNLLYLLHHPDQKEPLQKLRKEVMEMAQSVEKDGLTLDKVMREMPYCLGCINEALRIAPMVFMVGYIMPEGKQLHLRGHTVTGPANLFFPFANNYKEDETFFPSPSKFVPERWLPDSQHEFAVSDRAKQAFRPFGIGRHVCLGQQLAILVMKVSIFCLLSKPRKIEYDPDEVKVILKVFPNCCIKDGLPGRLVSSANDESN